MFFLLFFVFGWLAEFFVVSVVLVLVLVSCSVASFASEGGGTKCRREALSLFSDVRPFVLSLRA